jgi:hypothetical protein
MKKLSRLSWFVLGSMGLLFLGACSNSDSVANSGSSTPNTVSTTVNKTENKTQTATATNHSQPRKGGQVIESGNYHIEFVPQKESSGTHLDVYLLQGDNHEAVTNAKLTAQVQTPDGKQKSLNLTYDTEGKHYAAVLPETTSGEYKVVVLSDIKGEKVNSRFSFKR